MRKMLTVNPRCFMASWRRRYQERVLCTASPRATHSIA
jgi:hypothetical protein